MSNPRYGYRRVVTLLGLCAVVAYWTNAARSESPLADEIASVTIGQSVVALPPPSMPDGLDAAGQAAVLKQVAGKYPLDRFTRKSIVSPLTLQRETLKSPDEERMGHRIDLWFVAHGRLSAIEDQDLFAAMVESKGSSESDESGVAEPLADEELSARGIKASPPETGTGRSVAYHRFSVPVLDRVIVEGVVRSATLSSPESHFAGIKLDEAFNQDAKYPNRWRHSGEDVSSAVDYSGYAAYAKATKLIGFDDAILVECHAVMHEPREWFGGANLLASKLPLVIQDTVRRFRRNLAKQP